MRIVYRDFRIFVRCYLEGSSTIFSEIIFERGVIVLDDDTSRSMYEILQ